MMFIAKLVASPGMPSFYSDEFGDDTPLTGALN